ncbi:AraC family transcriptional regulator [Mycobacterium sp. URHB0044]|uniref:AraC family transcriptional regulator n=1 Tax=Mycobacterium sp. URHB0044 TaxID=1380386 RepID=UPI001E58EBA3|nr:AraC family transcriptional regulator [Mycobacterium sp. URHB0044]
MSTSTAESRTDQPAAIRRQSFHGADPMTVDGVIDLAYAGSVKITALADGRPIQHARYVGREFLLDEVVFAGRYRLDVEPERGALVVQIIGGTARYTGPDDEVDLHPGQPVLVAAELPCSLDVEHARLRLTAVDRPLLRRVAAEHPGSAVGKIQFAASRTPNAAKADAWNHALRFVTESVSGADAASRSLITDACARVLAASALTCFPNNAVATSSDGASDADAPHQLRRAISFIDENVGADIGVNDIAAAVHLSPRAVQYLFRRHLDLAPSQYVRNVRLDRAHQDLLASDRSTTTVSDVAARWGFGHTGRFAVLYRQTYGQSPHVTLRE